MRIRRAVGSVLGLLLLAGCATEPAEVALEPEPPAAEAPREVIQEPERIAKPEPEPMPLLEAEALDAYCFQWSLPGERTTYENRPYEARGSCFTALRDGRMEALDVDFGAVKALCGIPAAAEFVAVSPDGANVAFREVVGLTELDANGTQIPERYRYDVVIDGAPYHFEIKLLWPEWTRGTHPGALVSGQSTILPNSKTMASSGGLLAPMTVASAQGTGYSLTTNGNIRR